MPEVIPAILPKNYDDLKNKIALVRGIVPIAQIDICDGVFVKNTTWPFSDDSHVEAILNEQEGMPFWEDIDFELDLMVSDAVENFPFYTKLGPKRVIFHLEAQENLDDFKDFLEGMDPYIRDSIKIGVAVNPDTQIEKVFPILNFVDFVQCMGIEKEGFQGQSFDLHDLAHIKLIKNKFPGLPISVDGGVNLETAPMILEAGADRLVIGSAIFKTNDIRSAVKTFENLV